MQLSKREVDVLDELIDAYTRRAEQHQLMIGRSGSNINLESRQIEMDYERVNLLQKIKHLVEI